MLIKYRLCEYFAQEQTTLLKTLRYCFNIGIEVVVPKIQEHLLATAKSYVAGEAAAEFHAEKSLSVCMQMQF